jgi:hypothetical protein
MGRHRKNPIQEDIVDTDEHFMRWSRWKASGPESVISKVFNVLGARLPKGWRRLSGDELLPYKALLREGSACYALETTPTCVGFALSIQRPRETELMGGWVWFKGPTYPPGEARARVVWEQVNQFLDEVIIPAALEAGATISVPTPEDVFFSELPIDIRVRLQRFSDAARKSLPLNREEAELWRGFVIGAFRDRTVIEERAFINWLVRAGWPRQSAAELSAQFFDYRYLLSRYADEVSAA